MKFEVSSAELLAHLVIVNGAISPNAIIPILEDFLFELSGNNLTITGTNQETMIISKMEVAGIENGNIAIPGKILMDTLRELPEQPLSIEVNESNGITIKSSYGEYKLTGDNPEEFPKMEVQDGQNHIVLKAKTLSRVITNTIVATGTDTMKLGMTGVFAQIDFNKIVFAATDAHKLVKMAIGGISSDNTASFILPQKTLTTLKAALGDTGEVAIHYGEKTVTFIIDETTMVSRLIDATFPDYNMVIPVDNPNVATINRKDLISSLRRIAIYSNKTTYQVIFNLAENSLTISAQDLDFSNEATEQLSCIYSGEPMTIGYSAKNFLELINTIDAPDITLNLSTPERPGIIKPLEQKDNEDLLMLIMPVLTIG